MGKFPSIDELVAADARSLDDASLKRLVVGFGRARSQLDAAEAGALAELDGRAAYVTDGAVSAKTWLSHHTGISGKAAGARVRLAKLARRMPLFAAALADGAVTEGHVRAAGRCLTPRTVEAFAEGEVMLVGLAAEMDADTFDRAVTFWLVAHDPDGADPGGPDRDSHAHFSKTMGGRGRLDADLDVADAEEVRAELDALMDEEFAADRAAGVTRTRAQRMGAALAEMARRSSATRRTTDTDTDTDEPGIDPDGAGSQPRRPQLAVIVPVEALTGEAGAVATLEDGTPLPAEVLDRWACDSDIGRVVMAGASMPVNLGRLTRTPSAAQRRALITRDRGCVVAGCHRPARWCHAHHVRHWSRGGPTDIDNLVLVCTRHHILLHTKDPPIVLTWDRAAHHWHVTRPHGTPLTPLRHRPAAAA